MKKDNNDIKKLFRSFGADANEFQELARAADASEAESRWPLLSSVQPGKRELPPLLSREEKSQSWRAPEQHAQRVSKSAHPAAGLGDKLAYSLKQQLETKQSAPLLAQTVVAPVASEASLSSRSNLSSIFNQPATPVRAPEQPKGLFSFAQEKPAQAQPQSKLKSDDALSSVFKRIAQQADATAAPVLRKGLLSRLGRP